MSWFKLLRYDLRKGLTRKRYLAVPLLYAIGCFLCAIQIPGDCPEPGWMDRLLYCFKGMLPLEQARDFQLPVLWFLVMAGTLFLNLDYLLDDLTQEGQQVLVRAVNRQGWYWSKCVWNLLSCGLILLLGMLTALLVTVLGGGKLSLTNDVQVSMVSLGIWAEKPLSLGSALLVGVLLPYLTMAGFSQLQMSLCLYVKPVLSFLISVCLLVVSLLVSRFWLPGNGAMTLRSALLTPGLHKPLPLLITASVFLVTGMLVGLLRFRHMDLLRYEGE